MNVGWGVTTGRCAGQTALVTGAGSGFGRAIALALAAAGARVGLVGRKMAPLDRLRADIEAAGGEAVAVSADVTERPQVEKAVASIAGHFGTIRILVNNAGMPGPYGPIGLVDPDLWWQAQELHVRAPVLLMSAVVPGMCAAGGGCIINVVSRAGIRLEPNLSAYSIGKATAINLTRHVAAEHGAAGLRAFAIQPGDALTDMARSTLDDPDAQRWMPGMIEALSQWQEAAPDPQPILDRCGAFCVALASGAFDSRSGAYLDAACDHADASAA